MTKEADANLRQANYKELLGYAVDHTPIMHSMIRGFVGMHVEKDEEGAFLRLDIKEVPNDPRETLAEEVVDLIKWPQPNPQVQARVKIKHIE